MRVASVLPSATEIVCALGHESELVARSAECDYPATVARLPAVMRPRTFDFERPSAEIDARVTAARGAAESLYVLDVPLLRDLEPDLLLTQDLCGVCSVTDAEVADACSRAGIAPRIVSLTPRTLDDVWTSVGTVAAALHDPARGRSLVSDLRQRSAEPSTSPGRPRVAVVEWLDPPIVAGLWVPEMIRRAGGTPVIGEDGEPGLRTTWPELRDLAPDLVVLSPCSFRVERTRRELGLARLSREVEATAGSRGVFLADEAYFSRPGPRLADGVELLRGLLATGLGPAAPMPVEPWPASGPAVAA